MESVGEKLLFGLQTAALGLIVVFVALVLIIAMIKIVGLVARALNNKGAKKKAVVAAEKAPEKQPETVQTITNDTEIVAVITAAVACMLNTDTSKIRIKSIRKAGGSAWARAHREEQLYRNF